MDEPKFEINDIVHILIKNVKNGRIFLAPYYQSYPYFSKDFLTNNLKEIINKEERKEK